MAGINGQSGSPNGLFVPRDPTASVASLTQAVEEFMSEMERVTTPDKVTGRARLPGFITQPVINREIDSVVEKLDKNDIEAAWDAFKGARTHFGNQQAAFARGRLLGHLVSELDKAVAAKCDEDIIAGVRQAVENYSNLVAPVDDGGKVRVKFFDLNEASRLYWTAVDVIESAKGESRGRRRVQEAQAARGALQTACSGGAKRLRELLASQGAVV